LTLEAVASAWPGELPDTIDLAVDAKPLPADDRAEPGLASIPFLIEFDEPARLDPERVGLLWELPPQTRHPIAPRSPAISLLIHLLPLLTFITWPHPTIDLPRPIPVQLVIETPPPEPAASQPPQHQQGPLASEDFGDVKPQPPGSTAGDTPPSAGEKQPDADPPQSAEATPPPVPPHKPPPPKQTSAVQLLKPSGAPVPQRSETPHEAPRTARFAGLAASRDEYLAYLVALTRQHLDLLPIVTLAGRRGETIVSVVVLNDGTIQRISVAHSSGYPDIDERVERMVAAVRKFPPVPQWFQGDAMRLELTVEFPEALDR
jgi:protein TonB